MSDMKLKKRKNVVAMLAAACGKDEFLRKSAGKVADAVLSPTRKTNTKSFGMVSQSNSQRSDELKTHQEMDKFQPIHHQLSRFV